MPVLLSSLYLQKYFDAVSKERATTLMSSIEKEFLNVLETSTWIDIKAKDLAVMKASRITNFVGYPEEILDTERLEKIYGRVLRHVRCVNNH